MGIREVCVVFFLSFLSFLKEMERKSLRKEGEKEYAEREFVFFFFKILFLMNRHYFQLFNDVTFVIMDQAITFRI